MVSLGYVDELEVHRERPHDPLDLSCAHAFDPPLELFVQHGVIVEAEPLAQEPYLLLGTEEVFALLLY
jgi:hypothetical protein